MKKNLLSKIILLTLTIAVCAVVFVGCMRFTLEEDNVKARLKDNGYSVAYLTNAPVVDGWQDTASNGKLNASIVTILYGSYGALLDENGIEKLDENGKTIPEKEVWTVYCKDDASASWAENKAKDLAKETNRIAYRYEKVVVYGDYDGVVCVRDY